MVKKNVERIVTACKRYHTALSCFLFAICLSIMSTVECFASGETPSGGVTSGMTTALQTGFAGVQADVISIISTALPYALVIMGIIISIRVGVRFFKSTAK